MKLHRLLGHLLCALGRHQVGWTVMSARRRQYMWRQQCCRRPGCTWMGMHRPLRHPDVGRQPEPSMRFGRTVERLT